LTTVATWVAATRTVATLASVATKATEIVALNAADDFSGAPCRRNGSDSDTKR